MLAGSVILIAMVEQGKLAGFEAGKCQFIFGGSSFLNCC